MKIKQKGSRGIIQWVCQALVLRLHGVMENNLFKQLKCQGAYNYLTKGSVSVSEERIVETRN